MFHLGESLAQRTPEPPHRSPRPPESLPAATQQDDPDPGRTSRPSRYYSWPELMRRVFAVDVLRCPRCRAGPMRILAAIHPPTNTRAILEALGLPTRAPPLTPARPLAGDWTLAEPRPAGYHPRPAA